MRSPLFASERLAASSCQTCDGISRSVIETSPSRVPLLFLLDLAPSACPVVRNDLPEHLAQRARVDQLAFAYRHGPSAGVVVAASDDALRIRNDRAVVEKHVHMIFRGKQCADVSVQHEVRLDPPLDRFGHFRICGMDKIANLHADLLLPHRKRVNVRVDSWIFLIRHSQPLEDVARPALPAGTAQVAPYAESQEPCSARRVAKCRSFAFSTISKTCRVATRSPNSSELRRPFTSAWRKT